LKDQNLKNVLDKFVQENISNNRIKNLFITSIIFSFSVVYWNEIAGLSKIKREISHLLNVS